MDAAVFPYSRKFTYTERQAFHFSSSKVWIFEVTSLETSMRNVKSAMSWYNGAHDYGINFS
jgi:hypothetical protein